MIPCKSALAVAVIGGIVAASAAAQNNTPVPTSQASGGVSYVSGGVGEEQQERMQALAQQGYTLRLVFAEQGTGAYVADVHVVVADSRGRTVLDAVANGPAFYAKLPEGDYKVTLDYRGARQSRTVHASARGGQTVVYWPQETGSAPSPASSRAPHADGPALSPPHAGESAGRQ